jgi:hypothetical protein
MEETIFDYNVNQHELKLLYVRHRCKEDYIKSTPAKKILQDLYVLFKIREDVVRAGKISKMLFKETAA